MATYTVQGPAHTGGSISTQVPGGTVGDVAPTGQGIGLLVLNAGGTAITTVLPVSPTYDGLAVANRVVSVPPISGVIPGMALIPLPDSVYGTGTTAIQYSAITQMQVAVVRVP